MRACTFALQIYLNMTKGIISTILIMHSVAYAATAQSNSIITKKYNAATNQIVWPDKFNPSKSKFYVHNEIDIDAKPEVVWNILINTADWHTYYKGAESPVIILDSTTKSLKNNVAFKFHTMGLHLVPVIKEYVPNERMAWEVNAKNISGYHAWVLVPTSNGCRLITAESQNGFLTFLQKMFQPKKLLRLHDEWLKVIKQKSENRN
jgi:hypothetical protein